MSKVVLINYANHAFRSSQKRNIATAKATGGFNEIIAYGPKDINAEFLGINQEILRQGKGNGFWLWKPYFVLRTLEKLSENDWLFYCDAGSYFLHPISPLIVLAEEQDLALICFEDAHLEREFTKRDVFVAMDVDHPLYTESKQRLGGFHLWKNTPTARRIAANWLELASDPQLITDCPNIHGQPNYPGFRDHRHDQSIFSLLTKKEGLPAFRDPSQWGNPFQADYPSSTYPQLLELTRLRDVPRKTQLKRWVKNLIGWKP